MASQSMTPNGAATTPPTIPATSIQYAPVDTLAWFVTRYMMSKITEAASNPNGNYDEHLMHRMSEGFCSAFHTALPLLIGSPDASDITTAKVVPGSML